MGTAHLVAVLYECGVNMRQKTARKAVTPHVIDQLPGRTPPWLRSIHIIVGINHKWWKDVKNLTFPVSGRIKYFATPTGNFFVSA